MQRKLILLIFVLSLNLFTAHLYADLLSMRNGDKLSGQMLGFSSQTIIYSPAINGVPIEVPWSSITNFKTDQNYTITLIGGERATGKLTYSGKNGLTVISSKMGTVKIKLDELEKLELADAPLVKNANTAEEVLKQTTTADAATTNQEKTTPTYGNDATEEKPPLTFLRGSTVLLDPGQVEGRIAFGYQPTTSSGFNTVQNRIYEVRLGMNAGLTDYLEGWVNLPFSYVRAHSTSYLSGSERENSFGIRDVAFGFNVLLHQESADFAEVTLSLSATAPTGKSPYDFEKISRFGSGHWSTDIGINLVRSVDPAIIFGGISAGYIWPKKSSGYKFSYDNPRFDYYFGLGMAINDRLSFNTRFQGSYAPPIQIDGSSEGRFSSDPMWAGFGFSYRLNHFLVLEPQIFFGINDAAEGARFSIGLSKKFN